MPGADFRSRLSPRGATRLAAVLAALSMLSPFSIDTFFPSLRAMQSEFGVDELTVQQLLTAYMIPYAMMALVHGPLSDALGRRAVVLVGIAIYLVVSLGCMLAPNFESILAFRAMQGLTAGVGVTVGRAVIRDLYEGKEAQRLMSVVTMIFGVAPALAPVIGGWVHIAFGWRGVFGFLAFVSLLLLWVTWLYLPETHPETARQPFRFGALVRESVRILVDPRFFRVAWGTGTLFAALWIYIGSAPAIVMDTWGRGETDFGALFFPVIGGFMIGAMLSGRLAGRIASQTQLRLSLGITGVAAVAATVTALVAEHAIIPQQCAMALTALGVQLGAPVLTLRALDLYPRSRGAVSSLLAFVQLTIASVTLGIAPLLGEGIAPINVFSLMCAVGAIACAWVASKYR
jgi:DHA1 family bicyclomycin/chloramphenicol resistance-like MFS transporter